MKTKIYKGFTLIELLIVIAIIGILASIVLVSLNSARDKANVASAKGTLSSIMPVLVMCADEGGGTNAYNIASAICTDADVTTLWPSMGSNGYAVTATADASISDMIYTFTATKTGNPMITCNLITSNCTTP